MTIKNQQLSLLKQAISSTLNQHLINYPTPSNLSYWWGFGSLAGICLVIQIAQWCWFRFDKGRMHGRRSSTVGSRRVRFDSRAS